MTTACPLCGSDVVASRFQKAGLEYRRCGACALVYANGSGNANFRESIDDYEVAYRQYLDEGPVDAANLDDVIAWMESHIRLDAGARVLDVGAGSGKFLRHLRTARSCEISGIEPSRPLFETYGLAALGVEPVTLPQLASSRTAPFDVVTVLDVIEHIPEAGEFVRALGMVTRPGGLVFLSTPDANGPLARLLGRGWHHYNAYHFSLYGLPALTAAARLGGFEVIESGHHTKRIPLDYLWNYGLDFLLARRRAGARTPGRFSIPVNLGDILCAVWKKSP